ncbi:MAG: PorV/PorQ family protein [Candidatus Marinimicrobia bacterium]|nr:PorV/PorQ family protein [Candidatus Neomarinimicrobiota bacterium]
MKRITRILLSALLLLPMIGTAQSMVGTTAAYFLAIEVGGRSVGMGGAHVASVNDATALFWNPGAATRVRGSEALFVHSNWLAGTTFDHAAVVLHMGRAGTLGLSATILDYGDLIHTTIEDPDGTGLTFGATDMAIGLTLARAMTDRFSIGGTAKFISQKIWHEQALSVALDVGTLYRTDFRGLTLGMSISNFGLPMRMTGSDLEHFYDIAPELYGNNGKVVSALETGYYNLPLIFRAGIVMDVMRNDVMSLILAVDALHPNNNYESVNVGLEYELLQKFYVRAGRKAIFLEDTEEGLTLGVGLHIPMRGLKVRFDYGYEYFGRLQDIQNFSLALDF